MINWRKYILILGLIFPSCVMAQKRDTVFLERKAETVTQSYNYYHAVFLDSSDLWRERATDFSFDRSDIEQYRQFRKLKKSFRHLKSVRSIPKKWIELRLWKGKFYLYSPGDPGEVYKFILTDSATMDYGGEGSEFSRLFGVSHPSKNTIIIERGKNWRGSRLKITMIDPVRGMAVFTFGDNTGWNKPAFLMVDATKARLYPTVVNYCETARAPDFQFENIDLQKLIDETVFISPPAKHPARQKASRH